MCAVLHPVVRADDVANIRNGEGCAMVRALRTCQDHAIHRSRNSRRGGVATSEGLLQKREGVIGSEPITLFSKSNADSITLAQSENSSYLCAIIATAKTKNTNI